MARLKKFCLFLLPTGAAQTWSQSDISIHIEYLYRGQCRLRGDLWGSCGRRDLWEEGGRYDGDPDLHHEDSEPAAPEHVEPDLHDGDGDSLSGLVFT